MYDEAGMARARFLASLAALALLYLIAARLGLRLALVNPYATAVWPPTGIALWALLLWGTRLWPGVLIGAFLANVTTGTSVSTVSVMASLGIAAGNTLEAVVGAALVRRFVGCRQVFQSARNVFGFASLAAFASTAVSATLGVATLWLAGLARSSDAPAIWMTWWVGDIGGDLVFAPTRILCCLDWRWRWNRLRAREVLLGLLLVCALSLAAFTNLLTPGQPAHLGLAFLCLPALLWPAFRFGPRETAVALLLSAGIAIWGWLGGMVSGDLSTASVLLELQAYIAVTSIAILAVAAEVAQRRNHEQSLQVQAEALRRQAQILDYAHVLVRDTEDRIISWNPGAERLYGFSRAQALGAITHTLLQTRFPEPREQIRARIFREGQWHGELEQRAHDGHRIVVASLQVLHRDQNGQPQAILEVNNDITELKRVEEARLQLAAIVESSDDAIIATTLECAITSWNSGAEKIYGYTAVEMIGRPISILAPPGHEQEVLGLGGRLRRGEVVEHYETKRQRKDGTIIDVSVTDSPIKNRAGEMIGASLVARDITERKRLDEQFRQAQKLESLGVLAGGIAHDFNNLLVGILGNASLGLDQIQPDSPARTSIQAVVEASERAAALTRQMLAYSGRGQFVLDRIDLSTHVRKTVPLIRAATSRMVELRLDLAADLPAIEADTAQVQQLVMNLVINGAEAMPDGKPGTVTISTRRQPVDENYVRAQTGAGLGALKPGVYVLLEVEDTGSGMDDATQARIFEPFFTTKFTGRGLGLSAVLGIVRGHCGSIQVSSSAGHGSVFRVLFPALAASFDGTPQQHEETPDLSGLGAILVIDDEEIVRKMAKRVLERYGYCVLLAEDGERGLEVFRRNEGRIQCVVLDMTMPVMSGEATLPWLKSLRADIPVILSSGFSEAEAAPRFQGKGLAGFIQKPYKASALAEKVKDIISHASVPRPLAGRNDASH